MKMDTSDPGLPHILKGLGAVMNGVTGKKLALLKCHGIPIWSWIK